MNLSLINGSSAMVAAGCLVLALGSTVLVQCTQLDAASVRAKSDSQDIARLKASVKDEQDNRAETERRFNTQRSIANDAQRLLDHQAGNAAAALGSSQRLFRQFDPGPRSGQAANNPAAAASSASAPEAVFLSTELYGKLLARARRIDERARQFGSYADELEPRADACARSYDSLKP